MSNTLLIVGGDQSGKYIEWFGRRVHIDRKCYVQHRAYFTDGTNREYYVREGESLLAHLHGETVERIEVLG